MAKQDYKPVQHSAKKNECSSKHKARKQRQLLIRKLVLFYDEFADFKASCWFLCDALYCIASYEDTLEPDTAEGVRVATMSLQRQCRELKTELNRICDFARERKEM